MVMKTISRLPDVMARTGLSRSTIYQKIADGNFPRPIKLGPRAVGWDSHDVDGWIQHCIDASRQGNSG
jgi:prophage regulatory protein